MTTIFRAVNGSPAENMEMVISMMGGIDSLVGATDIVILKPNLQWWNQGAPNIAAVNALTTLIMGMKSGFEGEVVIAENIHRGPKPWEEAGWKRTFERNSDLPGITNYNGLAADLKKKYGGRFSVCHLIDLQDNARRVFSPEDGPGYVLCDGTGGVPLFSLDNGLSGNQKREVILSYPILRTDQGTLIDYRWGVWRKGAYTPQPVKLFNIAALNHHSRYCGLTSAVKNFLGISDLSGGPDPDQGGKIIDPYYNFHSFPFNQWKNGPVPGLLGAEIGFFIKSIRRPFLNITTAEYCGLIDRTRLPVARPRIIAASTDPVALDYHMAKYVLFPNSRIPLHHPDRRTSSLHQTLAQCADRGGYVLDEGMVEVKAFDFSKPDSPAEGGWTVRGEKDWGGRARTLLKYSAFRMNLV